jgi:hypothetical protein
VAVFRCSVKITSVLAKAERKMWRKFHVVLILSSFKITYGDKQREIVTPFRIHYVRKSSVPVQEVSNLKIKNDHSLT